ncbi:MAG: class I tRNA ligase family protein [Spirochaetales bacterium]|uniref:Class I tRNA ligase family protein n=1 Tax=Candidatus Thalassospirochaeta sargassi TaxID=3119039 RepID=A0AAJ1MKL9_9SPIO|nr:class I tRNA ligase family protein [Spirochaetales bacterium]
MLKLYNTMSRSVEEFKPRNGKKVDIFTCGPSIYQKAHLGNYRTFLYEDLLVRTLKYLGYETERAMNLTDIEDKAISEAKKRNTNVKKLTDDVLAIFHEGLNGFNFLMPDHLIPATESIEQSVKIIQTLVKKGFAYEYKGDYFFEPMKLDDFGKLFRLDKSRWPREKRRFKKDTYNGNRWNLGDFILWHNHKNDPDHPCWDTAIGRGRPSWNIQDPAVVTMSIGSCVDINCGGIDNIYRHHDYNIAVMEAYTGVNYANYYMHGEHLIVDGKTMSKSRGNIIYPEDLVEGGADWRDIRFFLTYTHYRKKLNYTSENYKSAVSRIQTFRILTGRLLNTPAVSESDPAADELINNIVPSFNREIESDLALGRGFDAVFDILQKLDSINRGPNLSRVQKENLNKNLDKIDNVLNVIYPI